MRFCSLGGVSDRFLYGQRGNSPSPLKLIVIGSNEVKVFQVVLYQPKKEYKNYPNFLWNIADTLIFGVEAILCDFKVHLNQISSRNKLDPHSERPSQW
jgi:hypothetical protein